MDKIPLFPDESNMARFQDFVNIQKEISEHLLEQQHLYEKIGRINRDVEDRVIKRRQSEFRMLKLIREQNSKYNELVAKRGTLTGQAAKDLESDIASTLQLIEYNRTLVNLSKLASSTEMEMAKKRYDEDRKWFNFVSEQFKTITGLRVQEFEMVKNIGDQMLKLGNVTEKMAYTVASIIMMLKGAFELFKKLDTSAWHFRKAMGMTRGESAVIRKNVEKSAIELMHLGVTADALYASYQELGRAVGGVHNVTAATADEVAIIAAQLGVAANISVGFMRNLAAVSKSSLESQVSMMYIAKHMSNAAGVQLDEVMQDIAKATGPTLTMMSRLPNLALRSAIELRRMGTSLAEASKSSRHILDFTDSINEEMEASVLLGRSINLQHARELAYRRDLEGSTKEILRITKEVNFEQLDVFQQEAFARATGKSVEELLRMLQTDKQIARVKRSGTAEQKEQLALYEKMRSENEKAAKARAKDDMVAIRQMANQERITAITAKWNQLLAKAQQFLLPVIDTLLSGVLAITSWLPPIMAFAKSVGNAFIWMQKLLTSGYLVLNVASFLSRTIAKIPFDPLFKVFRALYKIGGSVLGIFAKTFGWAGRLLGVFGKFLGPIGWVIMAFQGISGFIRGWNDTTGSWISKLGGGVMGALRGIIPGFDYIGKAIKWAVSWIGKLISLTIKWLDPLGWVVKAIKLILPAISDVFTRGWSKITGFFNGIGGAFVNVSIAFRNGVKGWIAEFGRFLESIVNGISSIGGKIVDGITSPFKSGWNKVKSWWGGNSPSQAGLSILQGITSVGAKMNDALTSPFRKGMAWIAEKIPGMGKIAEKLRGGVSGLKNSIESRVRDAYIPAVKVSPKGTEIAPFNRTPGAPGKADEKASVPMSEATGLKMVALLEKILAKDSNIKMDGQLLSTHLARQTEFRGGYGENKMA